MVKSNINDEGKPIHPAQSLLKGFINVIPNEFPSGVPHLRGTEHQLDLLLVLSFQTSRLIGVILISQRSFKDKSKSYLTVGTLRTA